MNTLMPVTGYAVIRCADGAVVAEVPSFPDVERAIMYRTGRSLSIIPLADDEIVGSPSLFAKMLKLAGYRYEPTV